MQPLISNNCEELFNNLMKRYQKSKVSAQGLKISLKINNFLKTLQRDLKKVNVDPKKILKNDSVYRKRKKGSSRNEKKPMERFRETKNVRCKTKVALGIKTQQKMQFRSGWFLLVLFEKNLSKVKNLDQKTCKKNNERQARKRQYNQLIIQNKQMQAQQSQAVQALQQQQAQILAFWHQRQ